MVVIGKLTLIVGNIPYKRSVLRYMPCDINGAFYIPIVALVANIFFEQALPHS